MHPTDSADQQAYDWIGVMSSSSKYSIVGRCDPDVQRAIIRQGPIRTGRVFCPVTWAVSEGLDMRNSVGELTKWVTSERMPVP